MLLLLGLPANLIVIIVSIRFRDQLSPSIVLITNLAIADALFLVNIPFKISGTILKTLKDGLVVEHNQHLELTSQNHIAFRSLCYFYLSAKTCVMIESIVSISLLAVDRFRNTFYPQQRDVKHSRTTYIRYCIFSWIVSLIMTIPTQVNVVSD